MTFTVFILVLIAMILSTVIGVIIGMLVINQNIKENCPELHKKWMIASIKKEDTHAAD